ncbi:MAG: nucleoside hydrolase [Clostridia bacterium]|nr:nucleoside hydrolase [Clostridia bacterium]
MRNFILGTDWWSDCDDVVALRLLCRAHKEKKINLLGIGINACMEYSAPSVEGFLNLENVKDVAVGIDLSPAKISGIEHAKYQKRLSASSKNIKSNSDAEDAVKMYRRLIAEADGAVEILEIGFLQVIAKALMSEPDEISPLSGIELFRKKVKKVWVMGGNWETDKGKEHNFINGMAAKRGASVLVKNCPVPITFLGFEIGFKVKTGGDILKKDDPLYLAMLDHGSEKGRWSWDPMLCMMALIGDEGKAGYNTICGTAKVNGNTGENSFVKNEKGLHKYVTFAKDYDFYANQINEYIK